jgi:hypothetical protein
MRRIQVALGSSESSFPSLQGAISAVKGGIRQTAAQETTALIKGLTIGSVSWTQKSLHLFLSDDKMLSFFLSNGKVDWDVREGDHPYTTTEEDASPLVLCFSNGTESLWEPVQALRPRINKRIVRIFASTAWVFLYTEHCRPLLLAGLSVEGCDSQLYWSDTD